ncbi:MAG TPA: hypothetical protein VKY65_14615 [Alphaproteobacteria bacterium]|nr:hypothetical protein [Alphaproteobacteria bacterium]
MRLQLNGFVLETFCRHVFIALPSGAQACMDFASGRPIGAPWFDTWTSGGERVVRLGKVEMIFTPKDWRERLEAAKTAA